LTLARRTSDRQLSISKCAARLQDGDPATNPVPQPSKELNRSMKLYAHPFAAYCQKALIALYENDTPFEFRMLAPGDERAAAEHAALWPLRKIPVLVDEGRTVLEATIIIEHLDLHHPGPVRMVPEDRRAALPVRMMDRFFDNYVMAPMQKIVLDSIRAAEKRDPLGVAEAREMLDTAYGWLDDTIRERQWAAGEHFSLADCAAAPSLFYADWAHPIAAAFPNVRAYRSRLLARPSFARAVDEARPYRSNFPLGAPDRD
jgi:glutathione S-transferase